jgi:CheY-like chemotaxis protein
VTDPIFTNQRILWIEEQYEEYDPLLEDLQALVGQEHVILARTGDGGRKELRHHFFDIVLLDLMLPQNEKEINLELIHLETGQQLLRELRQNTDWATPKDCKVVVFTARGNSDALNEVQSLLGPFGELIEKPTPVENVLQVVHEMLNKAGV